MSVDRISGFFRGPFASDTKPSSDRLSKVFELREVPKVSIADELLFLRASPCCDATSPVKKFSRSAGRNGNGLLKKIDAFEPTLLSV